MTAARVVTAAVLIPLVVAAIWWGPSELAVALIGWFMLLALLEFFDLGAHAGFRGYKMWTGFCALGLLVQQWAASGAQSWTISRSFRLVRVAGGGASEVPVEIVLLIFVLGIAVLVFASQRPLGEALGDIGISTSGLVFVALPMTALIRIDTVPIDGKRLLLFTLVFIWVGDTAAYFVGRWFGRVPMAAQVSPKKTWEGAAANLIGSAATGLFFARWLHADAPSLVIMAALGNIAGQIGDLLESAYKRSAGVKDSGTLLPGHGGVLDRIDALILAAPVVWYYFHMVLGSRL